jgi:restriction system protein
MNRSVMMSIQMHSMAARQAAYTAVMQNAHEQQRRAAALLTRSQRLQVEHGPSILLAAFVTPIEKTTEGDIVRAISWPWFKIIDLILKDPTIIYQLNPRQWEELIAGAYAEQGFEVILTPRSGDRGRDVIASSKGFGCIRYFDQVKRYAPHHLVQADDVRAMVGVLNIDGNVSKGIITTTSDFAPGVYSDAGIARLMPHRLELRPKDDLLRFLSDVAKHSIT